MSEVTTKNTYYIVQDLLRKKYGKVEEIGRGRGTKSYQRVQFRDGGQSFTCVIKTSSSGLFSFARKEDGTLSGLSDRAVLVGPKSLDGSDIVASMYESATLQNAWDANRAALDKAGKSKESQSWLTPFPTEDRGLRGVGDGFHDEALWIEPLTISVKAEPSLTIKEAKEVLVRKYDLPPELSLTIKEAKEALARNYDVPPEDIDIIIRG